MSLSKKKRARPSRTRPPRASVPSSVSWVAECRGAGMKRGGRARCSTPPRRFLFVCLFFVFFSRGKSKKRSRPFTAPTFRHQSHRCTLTHARKRGSSLHWVCIVGCGVGRACTLAKNLAAVGASRRVDRLWRRPRVRVGAEAVVNAVVDTGGHGLCSTPWATVAC